MAMLWEYPAEWQRARAVPALVVRARARRAAALAVGLSEPYEWISVNRQTSVQRTLPAPMTPLSVGPRMAAAVTAAATKAHDEVLQGTQVPPPPGSHQRLLARCSLRISRHVVRRLQTLMTSFSANERAYSRRPSYFRMGRPMPADLRLLDPPEGNFSRWIASRETGPNRPPQEYAGPWRRAASEKPVKVPLAVHAFRTVLRAPSSDGRRPPWRQRQSE